jgi:tetratricopeptide (TPR) repeat protein
MIRPSTQIKLIILAWVIFYSHGGQATMFAADKQPEETATASALEDKRLVPTDNAMPKPNVRLEGKAEVNATKDGYLKSLEAAKIYKRGVSALKSNDLKHAVEFFQRAGDAFESLSGYERFLGEARFAEAQALKLSGQQAAAAKNYEIAVDLFQEYDPLSPYLKPALDQLKKTAPQLQGKVARAEATLQAITKSTRIVSVDRNVILKGSITDTGNVRLLAEKGTSDVDSGYIHKTVKQAFLKMTCLETADLGSNYNTAEAKWLPLLASGRTVTVATSSDFMAPTISIKLNGTFYNVVVDLPELSANRRTVFLLTDGARIIAIDPATEDVWLMIAKLGDKGSEFKWKKLNHHKDKVLPPKK